MLSLSVCWYNITPRAVVVLLSSLALHPPKLAGMADPLEARYHTCTLRY